MEQFKKYNEISRRQDKLSREIVEIQLWIDKDCAEILELKDQLDISEIKNLNLPITDNLVKSLIKLKEDATENIIN